MRSSSDSSRRPGRRNGSGEPGSCPGISLWDLGWPSPVPQFPHLSGVNKNSLFCLLPEGLREMDSYIHTWMSIKYQINVKRTLFFLLNRIMGRWGVGTTASCTEGLAAGEASLSPRRPAEDYHRLLGVFRRASPLQKRPRRKMLSCRCNLSPLLPEQDAHRQFSN